MGSSKPKDFDDAKAYGSILLPPGEIRRIGIDGVLDKIPDSERYFVTIDMDVFDPSIAPGTGSLQPGGLLYEEVNSLYRGIARKGQIVAFDVVEVDPPFDPSGITSLYAGQIMFGFISYILKEKE